MTHPRSYATLDFPPLGRKPVTKNRYFSARYFWLQVRLRLQGLDNFTEKDPCNDVTVDLGVSHPHTHTSVTHVHGYMVTRARFIYYNVLINIYKTVTFLCNRWRNGKNYPGYAADFRLRPAVVA